MKHKGKRKMMPNHALCCVRSNIMYKNDLAIIVSLIAEYVYTYLNTYVILYLCNMENINYTEFRSNLKYWFDKAVDDVVDIVIKRKNGKDLVLVSLDEYNSLKETSYLLTGKNRDILLHSIKELESGIGQQHELID